MTKNTNTLTPDEKAILAAHKAEAERSQKDEAVQEHNQQVLDAVAETIRSCEYVISVLQAARDNATVNELEALLQHLCSDEAE